MWATFARDNGYYKVLEDVDIRVSDHSRVQRRLALSIEHAEEFYNLHLEEVSTFVQNVRNIGYGAAMDALNAEPIIHAPVEAFDVSSTGKRSGGPMHLRMMGM